VFRAAAFPKYFSRPGGQMAAEISTATKNEGERLNKI
jgi:hypothetical protein